MPNLNVGFFMLVMLGVGAHGATLHVGDMVLGLDRERRTNPGLAIKFSDTVWWGVLYPGIAPGTTLYVGDRWVGQNCSAGTYSPDGLATCIDCGVGHYCTGEMHRKTCTYGALACPGTHHETDGKLPNGAPINTRMKLADVEKYIPPTYIDQWQEITCCYTLHMDADYRWPETVNDVNNACASGVIGPGTYLFVTRYPGGDSSDLINGSDSLSGGPGKSSAYIAVFDHRVEYRSVNGNNIFHHFVDGAHFPYESYTVAFPDYDNIWANEIAVNVSGIDVTVSPRSLCVFELK